MKYLPKGPPKKSSSENGKNLIIQLRLIHIFKTNLLQNLIGLFVSLEGDELPSQPSLLLVVKWGGQLTQTGKTQAEVLGKVNYRFILNTKSLH